MGFYPAALVGSQLLTNPVGVAQGGTGATTAAGATAAVAGNWIPGDNAMLAATNTLDGFGGATAALVAGTLYLSKCSIRQSFTWTNVNYIVVGTGSGASTGSFVGLYNSAGTLLSGSADIGANLTASALYATPLTTPQALTGGTFVWVAFLTNLATTQPTLRQEATSAFATVNAGLPAAVLRAATNGTGLASLPASITPASNATTGIMGWFGAT